MEDIISKIKQKRELSGIDDGIIRDSLDAYLRKTRIPIEKLKASEIKILVKDVRANLRDKVGRFHAGAKDRNKLLEKGDISALLKTHSSTKERINFYPQLKEIIKKLKVHSILDLGCGLNPLALADKSLVYYASDINKEELKIVESYFQKNKIEGRVFVCDLNKVSNCSLPDADLCLILKVFDILGNKDYETAKEVLEKVRSNHLIVSFSTRTLSGKPMNVPRRAWFERLLESLCYKFEIIKSDNEIFYIV
jgi:hypothetical protein